VLAKKNWGSLSRSPTIDPREVFNFGREGEMALRQGERGKKGTKGDGVGPSIRILHDSKKDLAEKKLVKGSE